MSVARQTPWLNNLRRRDYKSAEARLEDEIWAYVDYMAPAPEEKDVVTRVGKHVRDVLRPVFPGCKIHTSGSTSTELRLPQSDIDLVIETVEEISSTDGLVQLADLVIEKNWAEHVDEILDARIPIIKISTTPEFGSLNFDVGINNIDGLKNNEWVKKRLRTMPALKPLVLIIRGALSQRGLNDASQHGLSSFAVVCMCVFFLQQNPYQLAKSRLADPKRKKSLSAILRGFLLYYSRDIPYKESYISVSRGKLVKKPKKGKGRLIHRRCHGNLVIQCPTDFARNITASLSLEKFEEIRLVFSEALEEIRNVESSNRNILGSLVSVDQRFMERRRQIRQLVRSGQLLESLQFWEVEPEEDQGEELFWGVDGETSSAMSPVSSGSTFHYPPHHQVGLVEYHPPHTLQNWDVGYNHHIGSVNPRFGSGRG